MISIQPCWSSSNKTPYFPPRVIISATLDQLLPEEVTSGAYDGFEIQVERDVTGPADGQLLSAWYAAQLAKCAELNARYRYVRGPEAREYFFGPQP